MTPQRRTCATIGAGFSDRKRPHIRCHVLRMDDDTFAQVRAAVSNGVSLSEQFRLLIEWGLEADWT